MENERKAREEELKTAAMYSALSESYIKSTSLQDETGIFFKCPLIGPAVMSKVSIRSFSNSIPIPLNFKIPIPPI